jgi:cell division protein FtsB
VEGLLQSYRKEIKEKQTLIDQEQKELEKYKKQKETKYLVDENSSLEQKNKDLLS